MEKTSHQNSEIDLLKSKNDRLEFIVKNSVDVIYEIDKSVRFTYISPSLYENLGYTQEEWIGHRISEFTNWKEFIKMARIILSAIKNYKTFKQTRFETVFFHKNGKPVHFEIVGKVMYNKIGIPIGVMGSSRNITVRKETEKNLKDSEAKLKEINASKDRFFSIIAHDLKSPFNGMLGLSNLLQDKFESFTLCEQKHFIELINSKLEDTYKLLDNLLMWAQSQKETLICSPEQMNLNKVFLQILKLYSNEITNKSITVVNQIPQDFSIIGDKNILATVIRNLLSNAIKFTPKNGKIILTSNLKSTENNGEIVEISIIDNGIGIPKETLNSLFTSTSVLSRSGTENESGSGFGLSLCKDILGIHNGDIRVESEVGKGSKFIVTIPKNK